jgi:hypothetical protein
VICFYWRTLFNFNLCQSILSRFHVRCTDKVEDESELYRHEVEDYFNGKAKVWIDYESLKIELINHTKNENTVMDRNHRFTTRNEMFYDAHFVQRRYEHTFILWISNLAKNVRSRIASIINKNPKLPKKAALHSFHNQLTILFLDSLNYLLSLPLK